MKIDKRSFNASPFVGVFGILTDKILLVPENILSKEEKGLAELTGSEVLKATLANSPLLGVVAAGAGNKIVVSEIVLESEIEFLENAGLKVKQINGTTALGNLVSFSEKGGVVSPIITSKQQSELDEFFSVKSVPLKIANQDLTGASVVATTKGFISHPQTTKQEIEKLTEAFKVEGVLTTANYGDRFVGNSVIANTSSVIVGKNTTGHELIRVEDAFYG